MDNNHVRIGDRSVGPDEPPYIIAEAGANHDGELDKAKRLIDCAQEANAHAVKFQNYTAGRLVTKDAKKWWGDKSTTQYETYSKLDVLDREDYFEMSDYAGEAGTTYLSTPFDRDAVDLLEQQGVPAYKIASCDVTYHPFLEYVAQKDKPIILSTGMSTLEEVKESVRTIEQAGNEDIVLLHCVSVYPTPADQINLHMMQELIEEFEYPVGLSDHTEGETVPIAAAVLGAAVIEKHFTFDKTLDTSPDHRLSADVDEMRDIVASTEEAFSAVGTMSKQPIELEMEVREKARRSLVTESPIDAGQQFSRSKVTAKRPGTGIPPKHLDEVEQWVATRDLPADHTIEWSDVEERGE
jgi:sialic acid synthase SpsE